MEQVTTNIRTRPKRSEKLMPAEKKALAEKVIALGTKYDACLFFGITRPTLDNILLRGSGKEATIVSIREKLYAVA